MSLEAGPAIVRRWGDPIYALAVLTTGQAARAEHIAVDALRQALAAPSAGPEATLYAALVRASRRRVLFLARAPLLDRTLRRLGPGDRLLLALWLLAEQSGEQLSRLFGVSPAALIARLDRLLGSDEHAAEGAPHLTRSDWLRRKLFDDRQTAAHLRLCVACRDRVAAWQSTVDALRGQLRAATAGARLPSAAAALLDEPVAPVAARRGWIVVLVLAILALVALIVVPWPHRQSGAAAAAPTPTQLVEAAIASWSAAPSEDAVHRRVRAVPLWDNQATMTMDVWLAAGGRHRWEAHSGNVLVEWQVADGSDSLRYGSRPEHASCRWKAGQLPMSVRLREGAFNFHASPPQQQAALAGRMHEGAFGTGYLMLQRALAAPDLVSLGRRQTPDGSVYVLRFTDRLADPAHAVVLEIDAAQGLRAVQALSGDARSATRDLWRVLLSEQVAGISLAYPGSVPPQREPLIDPRCPPIDLNVVLPPRELAFLQATTYLPAELPQGATAALFAPDGAERVAPSLGRYGNLTLLVSSSAGRLALEQPLRVGDQTPSSLDGVEEIEAGRWRLKLRRNIQGASTGWIEQRGDAGEVVRWYGLWATGWSRDELAAFVEQLVPFGIYALPSYEARFWDPDPLPDAARRVMYDAIDVARPAAGAVTSTRLDVDLRSVDQASSIPRLSDPYSSNGDGSPSRFVQRSLQRRDERAAIQGGRVEIALPDGTLQLIYAVEGGQTVWYDARSRLVRRAPAEPMLESWLGRTAQMEMLTLMFGSGELSVDTAAGGVVLERRWPFQAGVVPVAQSLSLAAPSMQGLPPGELLARLSLSDNRVQELEIEHLAGDGARTPLWRAVVTDESQPSTDQDLLALPPLGTDVLTIETTLDEATSVLLPSYGDWQARTFSWPAEVAAVVEDALPIGQPRSIALDLLDRARWQKPGVTELWRVTRFNLPGAGNVTLTQGPAELLRFVLRYSFDTRWTRSQAVSVTVAGREHEAWLLANGNIAALVVEVDGLLLHLTVPATANTARPEDVLRGPVRDALAQLVRSSATP